MPLSIGLAEIAEIASKALSRILNILEDWKLEVGGCLKKIRMKKCGLRGGKSCSR